MLIVSFSFNNSFYSAANIHINMEISIVSSIYFVSLKPHKPCEDVFFALIPFSFRKKLYICNIQ